MNRPMVFKAFFKATKTFHTVGVIECGTMHTSFLGATLMMLDGSVKHVSPEEIDLMQFTGLYDSKNEPVFEHDLLLLNGPDYKWAVGCVVWHDGFWFLKYMEDGEEGMDSLGQEEIAAEKMTIYGNNNLDPVVDL